MEGIDTLGANVWGPPGPAAAREFARFSADFPLAYFEGLWSEREDGPTLSCADRGAEIAQFLIECIEQGRPAAMIRFSDGEGNLLLAQFEDYPALTDYCVRRISYIHFGDESVMVEDFKTLVEIMAEAWRASDVVGIPILGSVRRGFSTPAPDLDVRAATGNRSALIYADRNSSILPRNAIVGSAWMSRHLLPHYQRILMDRDRVGLVSVYPELAEVLRTSFQIGRIDFHQVPVQAVFVPTAERENTGHFPDVYARVVDELQPEFPGMPYLIAAGTLGKSYAQHAKVRGAVAIDIGSIAEIWLGRQCRGLAPEFIERWKLV